VLGFWMLPLGIYLIGLDLRALYGVLRPRHRRRSEDPADTECD
jgi:hypothetical protein